jgi:hypothetical protein
MHLHRREEVIYRFGSRADCMCMQAGWHTTLDAQKEKIVREATFNNSLLH